MLSVRNLHKKIQARELLKNINLEIPAGQITGLFGPNGAGKTTCFYSILGLIKISQGEIFLNQHAITHLAVHRRATLGLGYLPQDVSIFRRLSVQDNILAILETQSCYATNRLERFKRLEQLLTEFQLTPIRDRLGQQLSGGERRRTEIARTLAIDPKFILLDEPFSGVDPISILEIKKIIQYLAKKNIGILITDHNVRETLSICQTAYILNNGQVLAQGTPEKLANDPTVKSIYLGESFVPI